MPVSISFLGHAAFLLEADGHKVAVDPWLTGNPQAAVKADDVACHAVVVTHGHADHFGDAVAIAKANNATVFAAFEICEYCGEQGVKHAEPMNPGGRADTDFGYVAFTPAIHSSSFEGRYMGMPCGAVVHLGGTTVYHLGDTTVFGDMRMIGEIYRPDVALVPIGDRVTMGPELATRAVELIGPKAAVPMHYDTWPMIEQDPADFRPAGVEVKVMKPGETWTYG